MFIRKHGSATPYPNYKTGFYANLAVVNRNFVCWGEILTHEHLNVWIWDLVLEQLKKIYGWKIWFEYNYLQSRLVIVCFQTQALFTASLTQERWKVKKNYGCILCMSDNNMVVSSMSCFVVVYFLKAITYMYPAFTYKSKFQKDY